jgi:DNA repair photolyase
MENKKRISVSLPLLQPEAEQPAPKLVGIARLAAEGEHLRDGHAVEYFTIQARSILNRCTSARMPFTWTINPYRGCEFACKYCYARYTHEFMEMRDPYDFERRIYAKQHTAELLRRDLKKVKPGEDIAIGTATDPYQPAERPYEITRGILETLSGYVGLRLGIVTKSDMVVRDIDLLRRIASRNDLFVNLTITTTRTELARILEPRAPRPDLRLNAIRRLTDAGIPAGVICAPVLPGITDAPRELDELVQAARAAGAQSIFANALFLKPCSASVFLPFLQQQFPALVERYRKTYASKAFLPDAYRVRLRTLMAKLRSRHGFPSERARKDLPARWEESEAAPFQLTLF